MTARGLNWPTTSWTDVMAVRQAGSPEAASALDQLCTDYWFPIYAYIRRRGHSPDKAQDLTQEFFYRMLKQNYLGNLQRREAKFRSFLLGVLHNIICDERDREQAFKRGGGWTALSLDEMDAEDRYARELASDLSPDKLYEVAWFQTILKRALARLRAEYAAAGKERIYDRLKDMLYEPIRYGGCKALAVELAMTSNTVAVAIYRLQCRYHELARQEIARTVGTRAEVEAELRHLLDLFARRRR
jgi:RNA polymerase sigma-70 factor (ECF subfamily)